MTDNQKLAACYDLVTHALLVLVFAMGLFFTNGRHETAICALGLTGSIFYLTRVPMFLTACEAESDTANFEKWACTGASYFAQVQLVAICLLVTYGMFK